MNENIHIKISASEKQELALRAKQLGLSLSGYIRLKLKDSIIPKDLQIKII